MKLLFVVSEHGFWAEECAEPLRELEQNHEVTVATPTGEAPEADPASIEGYEDFLDSRLKDPVPLMEAYRNRDNYDGLVLPGGHGTLWDINQDDHVQQILREKMEDSGALIICHAVGVLGFTPDITDGRDITGFPNAWEDGQVDENEVRNGEKLPYRVEDRVKKAGGNWDAEPESDISVKRDGKLVTARGPASSSKGAEVFREMIE